MKPFTHLNCSKLAVCRFSIGVLAVAGLAMAQDQTTAPHPWRSVDSPPAAGDMQQAQNQPAPYPDQAAPYSNQAAPNVNAAPADPQGAAPPPPPPQNEPQAAPAQPNPAQPNQGGQFSAAPPNGAPANGQQPYYGPPPQGSYPPPAPAPAVPATLTIKPGTYITVRTNQWLSSDRNQQGDTFTGTLEQPVVVDGFVIAQRGQTVYGIVSEAQKAGRVQGTSRLGLQLTQLTLADGEQEEVHSQMVTRNGRTSTGRDAAAIGGTTAVGAAIGAGAGWGTGAAIGAGAGAAIGAIGVMLTRGQPTVIYPETVLTFQITSAADISTAKAPQAFQPITAQNYGNYGGQPPISANRPYTAAPYGAPYGTAAAPPPAGYYGSAYPYPYPYAYGYPYPYYPYYGGFSVFVGPGFGYGYYGRRFYGGGYRFRR